VTGAALLALAVLADAPRVVTVASARGERRVPVSAERGHPALAAVRLMPILSIEAVSAPPGAASLVVLGRRVDFVLDAGYFRCDGRVYTLTSGPYVARDTLFVPLQWVAQYLPLLFAGRFRFDPARARLEERPDPALARADPARTTTAGATANAPDLAAAPVPASRAGAVRPPLRRHAVAIDPGHGGVDPGMEGPRGRRTFLREKDVTLAIARHLARELEARGITAALTRTSDTLIDRSDRGRIAGLAGADIFVSLHVNAANPAWPSPERHRGFETYFLGEALTEDARRVSRMEEAVVRFETSATAARGDPMRFILGDLAQNEHLRESSRLAEQVQAALGRVHPAESRGVKQAPFTVLYTSYMPAILVETGFGSNEAEARYLVSEAGQRQLARAIADGVERYLAEYDRRIGATR
jgi:N-acetylmuramoyl-L-alanine amidase